MSFLKKISKTAVLMAQLATMGAAMAQGIQPGNGWSYDPARDGMHDVRKLMPIEGGGTGYSSGRFCASGITSADGACYVQAHSRDAVGNKCVVVNPPACGASIALSEISTGNATCFTFASKNISAALPGTVCEISAGGGEWHQYANSVVCNTEAVFTASYCGG